MESFCQCQVTVKTVMEEEVSKGGVGGGRSGVGREGNTIQIKGLIPKEVLV